MTTAVSDPSPIAVEEPMMMLGGELVPLSRYQAHIATPVVDPVQVVSAQPAGATSIGQSGLTVQSSLPDPSPLSDDERRLIWARRHGLVEYPTAVEASDAAS